MARGKGNRGNRSGNGNGGNRGNGNRTDPLGPKALTPAQIAAQQAAAAAERRRLNDPNGGKSMANIIAAAPQGWTPGNGSIGNTYQPTTVKPPVAAAAPLPPKPSAGPMTTAHADNVAPAQTGNGNGGGNNAAPVANPTANMMVQGNQNLNSAAQATQGLLDYTPAESSMPNMNLSNANDTYRGLMKFKPKKVNAASVDNAASNAALQRAMGFRSQSVNADQANMGAAQDALRANMGYQAQDVNAQNLGQTSLDPYMNQYTGSVIDNTMRDMDRAREITQNDVGAQATKAGAFGGSRHGLVEAENNRNFIDRSGNMAAQLRHQGFTQAQAGAQYDIGNDFAGQQFNTNSGLQSAQIGNQAASTYASNALNQSQMNNQVGLQNEQNRIGGNNSVAGAASTYGNQALDVAGQRNDMSRHNSNQAMQAQQLALSAANAQSSNSLQQGQMNLQSQQFNTNAGLTANAQNMAAAGQLAGIGQSQFGQGNTVNQNLAANGNQIQGINQALLNTGQNMFGQFTGAPEAALGLPLAAVGAAPQVGTQTTQNNTGIFDWAALAGALLI